MVIPVKPYIRRWDPRSQQSYYEHRAIAEWKLGRSLRPGEVVHHENGDPPDNHPDNVRVSSSQRAHMLYHHYHWREARGVAHLFDIDVVLAASGQWRAQR